MKKTLLLLFWSISALSSYAQTKSTGVVNLMAEMTARLDLNNTTSTATLTLTGPSDRWFALQFGAFSQGQGMEAGQDVVYFNGTTLIDAVHNGIGSAPTADTNNWNVTSNTVASGTRTIVANRAFNTGSSNDYTFVYQNGTIDFAFAKMSSASFSLAYHGGGNRGYVIGVPVTTALAVGEFEKAKVALFPNPANNTFSIQSNEAVQSVIVYDVNGKQLAKFTNQKEALNIAALPAGLYFIEIQNAENQTFFEKLIKK